MKKNLFVLLLVLFSLLFTFSVFAQDPGYCAEITSEALACEDLTHESSCGNVTGCSWNGTSCSGEMSGECKEIPDRTYCGDYTSGKCGFNWVPLVNYWFPSTSGYVFTSLPVNLSCNINAENDSYPHEQHANLTLFVWNHSTGEIVFLETVLKSGTAEVYEEWLISLPPGDYEWNCLGCDNESLCRWATMGIQTNWTFTVDLCPTYTNVQECDNGGCEWEFNVTTESYGCYAAMIREDDCAQYSGYEVSGGDEQGCWAHSSSPYQCFFEPEDGSDPADCMPIDYCDQNIYGAPSASEECALHEGCEWDGTSCEPKVAPMSSSGPSFGSDMCMNFGDKPLKCYLLTSQESCDEFPNECLWESGSCKTNESFIGMDLWCSNIRNDTLCNDDTDNICQWVSADDSRCINNSLNPTPFSCSEIISKGLCDYAGCTWISDGRFNDPFMDDFSGSCSGSTQAGCSIIPMAFGCEIMSNHTCSWNTTDLCLPTSNSYSLKCDKIEDPAACIFLYGDNCEMDWEKKRCSKIDSEVDLNCSLIIGDKGLCNYGTGGYCYLSDGQLECKGIGEQKGNDEVCCGSLIYDPVLRICSPDNFGECFFNYNDSLSESEQDQLSCADIDNEYLCSELGCSWDGVCSGNNLIWCDNIYNGFACNEYTSEKCFFESMGGKPQCDNQNCWACSIDECPPDGCEVAVKNDGTSECKKECNENNCWDCWNFNDCSNSGCFWNGFNCEQDRWANLNENECSPYNCSACQNSSLCGSYDNTAGKCFWNIDLFRCEQVKCSPFRCDACDQASCGSSVTGDSCNWNSEFGSCNAALSGSCSINECWMCSGETSCKDEGCSWKVLDLGRASCEPSCTPNNCGACVTRAECTNSSSRNNVSSNCFWSMDGYCSERFWNNTDICSPDNCSACSIDKCTDWSITRANCNFDWKESVCKPVTCSAESCHACYVNNTCEPVDGCEWVIDSWSNFGGYCKPACSDTNCWACDTDTTECTDAGCQATTDAWSGEERCSPGCSADNCWACYDKATCTGNSECFWDGFNCMKDTFDSSKACNPENCSGCIDEFECHDRYMTGGNCEWNWNTYVCEEAKCSPARCDLCDDNNSCLRADCDWTGSFCEKVFSCNSENCWGCMNESVCSTAGCSWNTNAANPYCEAGCNEFNCFACKDNSSCIGASPDHTLGCYWSVWGSCSPVFWNSSVQDCNPDNCGDCTMDQCNHKWDLHEGNCHWNRKDQLCEPTVCSPETCYACLANTSCNSMGGCNWQSFGIDEFGFNMGHCKESCSANNCRACSVDDSQGSSECANQAGCNEKIDFWNNNQKFCEQGCSANNCWACDKSDCGSHGDSCVWSGMFCEMNRWKDIPQDKCSPNNCSACLRDHDCWNWDMTGGQCEWDWKSKVCIQFNDTCDKNRCHHCGNNTDCTDNGCFWNAEAQNFKGEKGICEFDKNMIFGDINCDDECWACNSEVACNLSDRNNNIDDSKHCLWMIDPFMGEGFCGYQSTASKMECRADNCFGCFDNQSCEDTGNCTWALDGFGYGFCNFNNPKEICFIPGDEDNNSLSDCDDPACFDDPFCSFEGFEGVHTGIGKDCFQYDNTDKNTCELDNGNESGCFWHKPGEQRGNCTPSETQECLCDPLIMEHMKGNMDMGIPPEPLDNLEELENDGTSKDKDTMPAHLDLIHAGIKDDDQTFILSMFLRNSKNISYCKTGDNLPAFFRRFIDRDNNESTGCDAYDENGDIVRGFEYKFVHISNSTHPDIHFSYICRNNTWKLFTTASIIVGIKDTCNMQDLINQAWKGIESVIINWQDIGGKKGNLRIFLSSGNQSNENNIVDSMGPYRYKAGTIDVDPVDCKNSPGHPACKKFNKDDGFFPVEDCIKVGDEDKDGFNSYYINETHFDCSDPVCHNQPWCIKFFENQSITDNEAPSIMSSSREVSNDFAFIQWINNEPTNATFRLFNSSRCINLLRTIVDIGLIDDLNDDYKPFHSISVTDLEPSKEYGYRTRSCDPFGNCLVSKCINFTTRSDPPPVTVDFQPPADNVIPGFNFRVCQGNDCVPVNTTNTTKDKVNMSFSGSEFSWELGLEGASISGNKSINLSRAFSIERKEENSTGNRTFNTTFIGMNSGTWNNMAQSFGSESIKIKFPVYFDNDVNGSVQLIKCENSTQTREQCINVSHVWTRNTSVLVQPFATRVENDNLRLFCILAESNATEQTTTWRCPSTIGFSVFAVYMAETVAGVDDDSGDDDSSSGDSPSGDSPSGGSPGGAPPLGDSRFSKAWSTLSQGIDQEVKINKEGNPFIGLRFTPTNNLSNPGVAVKVLDKASSVTGEIPRKAYQYIQLVETNLKTDDIEKTYIEFKVEKQWIFENNLSNDMISLYRFVDGIWQEQDTVITGDDSEYVYYKAKTTGFSYFAIGISEDAVIEVPIDETEGDETGADNYGDELIDESSEVGEGSASGSEGNDPEDTGIQETSTGTDKKSDKTKGGSIIPIVIVVGIIVAGLVAYLVYSNMSRKGGSGGSGGSANTDISTNARTDVKSNISPSTDDDSPASDATQEIGRPPQ
jgi:PGF-pre-PGF domain-containing protein